MPEKDLSIFLSGTRRDIPDFWPAARDALKAAFPNFVMSMMEDAEPEDIPGDHWSRREATIPDLLVGLVGRYYGKVLRGHDRSLTEQEFDVAEQVGIDRLMFTTDSGDPDVLDAQPPQDRERVEIFRAKIDEFVVRRGIATPEDFGEHAVRAVQSWEKRTLRGALQDAKVFFAPLLDPDQVFSHTEPLVGQAETLQQLRAFSESDKRILILHAPWGRGKTRVLLELSRNVKPIRFLRDDIPLTRQHLEVSAVDPMIVVLDDLQRRDDLQLQQLLAFLQRCDSSVKLVVGSRTSRVETFTGLIRAQGLPMDGVETIELPELTETEQHDLIAQVLGVRDDQTYSLAVRTRGSALAALLAARMIRSNQATFGELDQNPDFTAEVLGRFQDALLAPDLDPVMRERLKRLLQVIAIAAPIRPGEAEQRDALARFLGRQPEEIVHDIELLENRGLLLRRGGLVTIPIDAVRETEALRACVTTRGELSGLAERALRELTGAFRGNLLRNLALVDARAEKTGQDVSLLDRVWPEIEGVYDSMPASQRLSLLRDLKDVPAYQPSETLRFVRHALPSGFGPPETDEPRRLWKPLRLEYLHDALSALVRDTLYYPDHVEEACDLLWEIAKDDSRPARQYTDSAERVLVDFAGIEAHRPIACYQAFLRWVQRKQERNEVPGYRLVTYLEPLLAKEIERGYSDDRTMTWWSEGIRNLDLIRPLHERALAVLGRLARADDLRTASTAISAIGHALRPPGGSFARQITEAELTSWEPEQLAVMEQLRAIARERQRRIIDLCILHSVAGMARFSEQPAVRASADGLARELLNRLENSIELALMPSWSPPWDHSDESQEAHRSTVAATAARLLERSDHAAIVLEIRMVHEQLRHAGRDCRAWTLVNELTKLQPDFGTVFVESMLSDDPPVAEDGAGVLSALLEQGQEVAVPLLDRAVTDGRQHLHRAIARGYFSPAWRAALGEERFLRHCQALLHSPDPVTRIETIRAVWLAREFPARPRADMVLTYDPAQDPPGADMWPIAVNDLYGQFTGEQRLQLIARLEGLPSLDYFEEEVLAKLVADEPAAVVDMLLARVRCAGMESFEAISSRAHRDFVTALPTEEQERGLRALGPLLRDEDFHIRHAAQELFVRLGSGDPAVRRRVRMAWAESGDRILILCAGQSFRREPSASLFQEEDAVIRILQAAKDDSPDTYRFVLSELLASSSTEVRTGSARDPDYLDAQIRDHARSVAARHEPGSVGHLFYTELADHAQSILEHLSRREVELLLER